MRDRLIGCEAGGAGIDRLDIKVIAPVAGRTGNRGGGGVARHRLDRSRAFAAGRGAPVDIIAIGNGGFAFGDGSVTSRWVRSGVGTEVAAHAHKIQYRLWINSGCQCGSHHLGTDDSRLWCHWLFLRRVEKQRLVRFRVATKPLAKRLITHPEHLQHCNRRPFFKQSTAAIAHAEAA